MKKYIKLLLLMFAALFSSTFIKHIISGENIQSELYKIFKPLWLSITSHFWQNILYLFFTFIISLLFSKLIYNVLSDLSLFNFRKIFGDNKKSFNFPVTMSLFILIIMFENLSLDQLEYIVLISGVLFGMIKFFYKKYK